MGRARAPHSLFSFLFSKRMSYPSSPYAQALVWSCWNALIGGVYQTVGLQYIPTFFHSGGYFQLQYYNQMQRDGPQLVYQNGKTDITLKLVLDDTYIAQYSGGDTIVWNGTKGSMTWERTQCWPETTGVGSTTY
jgi:hypothetical protein